MLDGILQDEVDCADLVALPDESRLRTIGQAFK